MNIITMNTPYNTLPPTQRIRKFQEQILNCKNELEKKQKAKYKIFFSFLTNQKQISINF